MARPGVTYQDIISAANELKGQGKSITIENIRTHLGTGSIGTINKYLRQWREVQASTGKIASKENLPEELISLVKGLWEGVLNQSTQRFEPIETNYQQEISELKAELEKYKNNNQRWQKLFNQWQQEKIKLDNEKLTLEQALEFAHKENHSMQVKQDGFLQQLQEKQARVDELHRLHQQAQENLEHYREAAREQRLLDQQQYENHKQQLLAENKMLNDSLMLQREKFLTIQQQFQLLEQTTAALEKNHAMTQATLDQVFSKLELTEKEKNESENTAQHWQNQYKELQQSLQEKSHQLMEAQTESKLLLQQLSDSRQTVNALQDQNKLLGHDKWILAQEKSHLEGQLKQMQQIVSA